MARTRTDALKFVHTDVNDNLYGVSVSLDGVGRMIPYPSVDGNPVHPDISYNSEEEGVFTVDAASLEPWRTLPANLKKVWPLYEGGLPITPLLLI